MNERREEHRGQAWEIIRSQYVVKDRWISLRADDCRTANGESVAPYYVLEYPPWVSVLALTPEQDVVLIKQYRHGIRRTILEFPGGAVDQRDGSAMDAARRELLEETGYAADDWLETGSVGAAPQNHTNMIHCFLALGARYAKPPEHETSEQIETVVMPWDAFLRSAYGGELQHSHHVACLFFGLRAMGKA